MAALTAWASRTLAVGAALTLIAACSQAGAGHGQLSWAQAALERNPNIEVIAVDQRAGTLKVRLKLSGVTRVLAADQVVGTVPQAIDRGAASPVNPAEAAGARSAPTGSEAMDVADSEAGAPVESQAPAPAAPAASATQAFSGDTMPPPPKTSTAAPTPAPPALRPGQRVVASGPGYSIVVTSKGGKHPSPASAAEARVTDAPLERVRAPIVCDGSRLLHIDNRNLEFQGNAITATHGCDIRITNSRIAAGGIGILARGASVHVENSQIIGHRASIEALDGAQVYVETSTFDGPRRRLGHSAIHDLGGNIWE